MYGRSRLGLRFFPPFIFLSWKFQFLALLSSQTAPQQGYSQLLFGMGAKTRKSQSKGKKLKTNTADEFVEQITKYVLVSYDFMKQSLRYLSFVYTSHISLPVRGTLNCHFSFIMQCKLIFI